MIFEDPSKYTDFVAITPHDTNEVECRAIFVGGAGTVVAENADGVDVTFSAIAGQILPIGPKLIKAASTATNLVGLR